MEAPATTPRLPARIVPEHEGRWRVEGVPGTLATRAEALALAAWVHRARARGVSGAVEVEVAAGENWTATEWVAVPTTPPVPTRARERRRAERHKR